MSAITFEQQQIFKDAIFEVRGNISSVLYGISHNDLNHQRRNYETIIDLASTFSRVFHSVPSFSARFNALFDVFNQSRIICFLENKIEWFLSKIQLVLESWFRSLNPLPCSTAVFAQGREDGAADPVSNKAVQPKIPASLQSLGAVDTGFVPECSHCSNDYWIASPAPDAAFCPFCGFSGLADSECAFYPNYLALSNRIRQSKTKRNSCHIEHDSNPYNATNYLQYKRLCIDLIHVNKLFDWHTINILRHYSIYRLMDLRRKLNTIIKSDDLILWPDGGHCSIGVPHNAFLKIKKVLKTYYADGRIMPKAGWVVL